MNGAMLGVLLGGSIRGRKPDCRMARPRLPYSRKSAPSIGAPDPNASPLPDPATTVGAASTASPPNSNASPAVVPSAGDPNSTTAAPNQPTDPAQPPTSPPAASTPDSAPLSSSPPQPPLATADPAVAATDPSTTNPNASQTGPGDDPNSTNSLLSNKGSSAVTADPRLRALYNQLGIDATDQQLSISDGCFTPKLALVAAMTAAISAFGTTAALLFAPDGTTITKWVALATAAAGVAALLGLVAAYDALIDCEQAAVDAAAKQKEIAELRREQQAVRDTLDKLQKEIEKQKKPARESPF